MSPTLMDLSRGYRDVIAENCWADWQRLRVQMTGNGYLPKIVLCFTGDAEFEKRAVPILQAESVDYEFRDRDERMAGAFEAANAVVGPSLDAESYRQIDAHEKVLYILSDNFASQDALLTGHKFLLTGGQLLRSGATAVKSESSGIAHSRQRWCE